MAMRLLLLVCCLALVVGCKTNPYGFGDKPKDLVYKSRAFGDTVRWGALEKMVVFLKTEPGVPVPIQEGLGNIRVISYEIASPLTEIEEMRWVQTAVIDYVLTDRQIVRQLVDQQIWVSDDEGESWYRENPVPQFR